MSSKIHQTASVPIAFCLNDGVHPIFLCPILCPGPKGTVSHFVPHLASYVSRLVAMRAVSPVDGSRSNRNGWLEIGMIGMDGMAAPQGFEPRYADPEFFPEI
jgi:hypothetical protein